MIIALLSWLFVAIRFFQLKKDYNYEKYLVCSFCKRKQ